jgi:hypothetical protein
MSKKKRTTWPEALVTIVGYLVLGWIVFSVASCTANGIRAKAGAEAKVLSTPGTFVW